jgi:hypothetical protein
LRTFYVMAGAGLAAMISATPLQASSEAAWDEFRANVKKGCEAAVSDRLVKPTFVIDPHGTETYGVAVAKGRSKYGKARLMIVCVFDKKTQKTETSNELTP